MKLITLIAFAALVCLAQGLDLEYIQSKANKCCLVGCSSAEMDSIKAYLAEKVSGLELNKEEAAIVGHATKVVTGEIDCPKAPKSGTRARSVVERTVTGSGSVNITCPNTVLNVNTKPASILCRITASIYNDTLYYVYGYAYPPNGGNSIYQYVYLYQTPTSYYSGFLNFTVPQYAQNGTWTVYSYGYDTAFTSYIYGSTSSFVVATGINDNSPPTLNSAVASTFSVNPCALSNYLTLNVSDNLSGISTIYAYAYASNYIIQFSGYYSPPLKGNQIITIPGYSYTTPQVGTQYSVQVELVDATLNYAYFYSGSSVLPYITPVASNCNAGYFAPVGSSSCSQCPANQFSNNGSISCCACPAGTISAGPGASQCISCPIGFYSLGGSTQCTKCPAGTYSYSTGTAVCQPCSAGQISAAGAQYCSSCPSGTSSCSGATTCTACAKGTYSSYGSACVKCSPGYYTPTAGATTCTPCPANTYAAAVGALTCTACPNNKKGPAGSNSVLNCA